MNNTVIENKVKFKIPRKSLVEEVVYAILEDMGCIDSFVLLRKLVLKRLKYRDSAYTISARRLRRIAACMDTVYMKILTAESQSLTERLGGDKALVMMRSCIVCGSKLKPVRNQTLYGWVVVIEKKCPVCGYWTGQIIRRPYRYEICIKRNK